jgi:hypothetical protein
MSVCVCDHQEGACLVLGLVFRRSVAGIEKGLVEADTDNLCFRVQHTLEFMSNTLATRGL